MIHTLKSLLVAALALLTVGLSAALANPAGSSVVAGTAAVAGEGTASVVVTQSTNKAIINWQSFDIGTGESTQFVQPSSSSVTLNRVTGGLGASQINGALTANGNVFLINPDGILFGQHATVDVGGLVATTNDIDNTDFMAGNYAFTKPGKADASVVNAGTITAENGGFAALVAPGVRNSGTITARLGKIGLASAHNFTLDLYGDQLLTLSVNDQVAAKVKDVQTGQPLSALVKNEGTLKADGGTVQLTAAAARTVVDSVINNTGVIEANSVGLKNGRIVLGAATASSKPAGAPVQKVKVSGTLSVAGKGAGETGGKVQITGEDIALTGATIDASGAAGGGTILIGGDVGGGHPSAIAASIPKAALETDPVPNATTTTVDASSTIDASATDQGDGGKVVVWADGLTAAQGTISTDGGPNGGNGGFAEVSGGLGLDYSGLALNIAAPEGIAGTGLFDPYVPAPITSANVSTITNMLNQGGTAIVYGSSVSIQTNILKTAGASATLKVFGDDGITINPGVIIGSSSGPLNMLFDADADVNSHFNYGSLSLTLPFADSQYPGTGTTSEQGDTYLAYVNALNAAFDSYVLGGKVTVPSVLTTSLMAQNYYTALQAYISNPAAVANSVLTAIGDNFYTNGGTFTAYGNQYQVTLDDRGIVTIPTTSLAAFEAALATAGAQTGLISVITSGSQANVLYVLNSFQRTAAPRPLGVSFASMVSPDAAQPGNTSHIGGTAPNSSSTGQSGSPDLLTDQQKTDVSQAGNHDPALFSDIAASLGFDPSTYDVDGNGYVYPKGYPTKVADSAYDPREECVALVLALHPDLPWSTSQWSPGESLVSGTYPQLQ
ncbi:MAG TPA: filamentous hemagglutinin N-terminal domain-containing protein, partial [Bauldia sp.]